MVKDNTLGSRLIDIVATVVLVALALSTILPLVLDLDPARGLGDCS